MDRLSPRQRQVVMLLMHGLSNREIGRTLNISEGTVKAHLRVIFTLLNVTNRYTILVRYGDRQ